MEEKDYGLLIESLKEEIRVARKNNPHPIDYKKACWQLQIGVLISISEAEMIVGMHNDSYTNQNK